MSINIGVNVINWILGKPLINISFDTLWWITKKTSLGLYYAGSYIFSSNDNVKNNQNNQSNQYDFEFISLTEEEISLIKENNKLLKEELDLLKYIKLKDTM